MKTLKDFISEYKLMLQRDSQRKLNSPRPTEWTYGKKGDVIIVPGFNETWVYFTTIANFLNKKGYRIHVISPIEHNTHPVDFCVSEVTTYIEKHKLKQIYLLAHSKGGVIVRLLLDNPSIEKRIKYAFIIAVPNSGTLWGIAKFRNLDELWFTSPVVKSLHRGSKKLVNIYPRVDQHVIPNKNLYLPGAINIPVDIVGHTRILESTKTQKIIEKYI